MNDADDNSPNILPPEPGEVGIVEPRDYHHAAPFTFDNGKTTPAYTLRYETYGHLNPARDNAILICHALSGDHHCAGIHTLNDRKPGWWNNLIGPNKAVDTNKYYVICANVLGGCQGSTGPSSLNPDTGKPYALDFPNLTIRDMVRAQKNLLDHLGIPSLHALIGGSMGGMQVLQFGIEYPAFCKRLIPMATTARESAMAIAFNEVGRQAIMQDPAWNHGNYTHAHKPSVGLAIARMMAHITYLSDASMDRKFGRKLILPGKPPSTAGASPDDTRSDNPPPDGFDPRFQVQTYLRHQAQTFINRFDANTYLYITQAIDQFDLVNNINDDRQVADTSDIPALQENLKNIEAKTLVVGFTSDWLFPPEQNREIVLALLRAGKSASYAELSTDLGHDSFLLESPQLYNLVRNFLQA